MTEKPKTGSLNELGLQRFMDGPYYRYGGYVKLIAMFEAGAKNTEVAKAFSPPDRPKQRQTITPWRARWELEKEHPELRQGGMPIEAVK